MPEVMELLERGDDPRYHGADCDTCPLLGHAMAYPEKGDRYVAIALVGEAPGAEEIKVGRPFVGRAGRLLNQALADAGLSRESVFVDNSVCCRPPGNTKPGARAITSCRARLWEDLQDVQPKVVVALGNSAVASLVEGKRSISAIQGTTQFPNPEMGLGKGTMVVPAWHPAAVLRSRSLYSDLVRSLRRAKEYAEEGAVQTRIGGFGLSKRIEITVVKDQESFDKLERSYQESACCALDIESRGLNPYVEDAQIYTIAFAMNPEREEAWVLDLYHWPEGLNRLGSLLSGPTIQIWHNGMFDIGYLRRLGVTTGRLDLDTLLLSYVIDESTQTHGLEHLADQEFGAGPYKSIVNWDWSDPERIDWEKSYLYNGCDAFYTLLLGLRYRGRVRKNEGSLNLSRFIHRAADPLMVMQETGVRIDMDALAEASNRLRTELEETDRQLYEMGVSANPNSPAQVAKAVYEEWGLLKPDPRSGKVSVDRAHLSAISEDPRVALILRHKSLDKILSTFIAKIPGLLDRNGRIHTQFKPYGTVTGRLSSGDSRRGLPNLQQIPRPGDSVNCRTVFAADPGKVWAEIDVEQAELRVMADFSQDPYLVEELKRGTDIHRLNAALLLGKKPEEVTSEERQMGKTFSFAVAYGAQAHKIAAAFGVSVSKGQELLDLYYSRVPGLRDWQRRTERSILQDRRVVTPTGRVRHFLFIDTRDPDAVREGINAVVQSAASDIVLASLIRFHDWIRETGAPVDLLLTVHDSISFQCAPEIALGVGREVAEIVSRTASDMGFKVPFETALKIGPSWGDARKVEA